MKQALSDWMDSELDEAAVEALLADIETDATLQQTWHDYHLVGDALRQECHAVPDAAFMSRFSARLAQEPPLLAHTPTSNQAPQLARHAANDNQWLSLAVAAAITCVTFTASFAMFRLSDTDGLATARLMSHAHVAATDTPRFVSAPGTRAYLAAHQEYAVPAVQQVAYDISEGMRR